MCYGGLETKYITSDIEARMKPLAFVRQNKEEPAKANHSGLTRWIKLWAQGLRRKDDVHV